MVTVLSAQVIGVAAVVERYVAPTSNFTVDVNAELVGAIADDYMIHLSTGVYTGCGTASIDLGSGSALSVNVIGAGDKETTIDCEDVVLMSPVFTCGGNCMAVLQNVTVARVRMTTASPDDVGALVNVLGGASVNFQSVDVTSCWTVTNGGVLPYFLTAASSIVRVTGFGTLFVAVDSTFSYNTGEIGSISAFNNGKVSVSGCHFEFNLGGGGSSGQGLGGVFSFAFGAKGDVSQSSFLANSANGLGGVVFAFIGGDVSFVNVTTQESWSVYGGVVSLLGGGDVSFVNVTTQESSARIGGGVVCSTDGGGVSFVNVTTEESSAHVGGVVSAYNGGDVSFVNVTIQDSSAGGFGGVVSSFDAGDVSFVNVITQESSAGNGGGVVHSEGGGCVSFSSVTIQESSAVVLGGVVYSMDGGDVRFFNVITQKSSAEFDGGRESLELCFYPLFY